jgi:hypothetical protein
MKVVNGMPVDLFDSPTDGANASLGFR